jgi:hypothetical protein
MNFIIMWSVSLPWYSLCWLQKSLEHLILSRWYIRAIQMEDNYVSSQHILWDSGASHAISDSPACIHDICKFMFTFFLWRLSVFEHFSLLISWYTCFNTEIYSNWTSCEYTYHGHLQGEGCIWWGKDFVRFLLKNKTFCEPNNCIL